MRASSHRSTPQGSPAACEMDWQIRRAAARWAKPDGDWCLNASLGRRSPRRRWLSMSAHLPGELIGDVHGCRLSDSDIIAGTSVRAGVAQLVERQLPKLN